MNILKILLLTQITVSGLVLAILMNNYIKSERKRKSEKKV